MRELAEIRRDLPALSRLVYLNTATAGPMPAAVAAAMRDAVTEDEERGRISGKRFQRIDEMFARIRAKLAALTGTEAARVALTSGTTDGLDLVLDRLALRAGDRIVTCDLEHPAVLELLHLRARQLDLRVEVLNFSSLPDAAAVQSLAKALAPGAALVLLSHVAYATGRILPVQEAARVTAAMHVPLAIDGAQAAGAIPLDFAGIGAEFYAFPGQKWLLGPEGTGALLVSPRGLDLLAGRETPPAFASEFERGTLPKPVWAGLEAALDWRAAQGSEADLTAAALIAAGLRDRLAALPGLRVEMPEQAATLVSFAVEGRAAAEVAAAVGAARIGVRDIAGTGLTRIACGFFTSDAELAAAIAAVAQLAGVPAT